MKFTKAHARILAVIEGSGRKGITVPEIAETLKAKRYERISSRCSELDAIGRAGVLGKRKRLETGKDNSVYVAAKYLPPRGQHDERLRRKLLDVRRETYRRLRKLPMQRKVAAWNAFVSLLPK